MPPSSQRPPFAALLLAAALSACSPPKQAETPESSAPKEESGNPSSSDIGAASTADTDAPPKAPSKDKAYDVDKSMSMDTYEMTPSDCDALGRQYGEVSRADLMSALSPKLSEKQRAATAAQVEKVVSERQETWISTCQRALVNKAVDHDGIKCALSAKTVKAFDVCINGTSEPVEKPKKTKN